MRWSHPVTARTTRPHDTEFARMLSIWVAIGTRGASGWSATAEAGMLLLARSSTTA